MGQPEGVVLGVLERIGLAPTTVRARLDDALGAMPQVFQHLPHPALVAEAHDDEAPAGGRADRTP